MSLFFFFFNDTATTEIYTLSLHDALPICKCTPRSGETGELRRARLRDRDLHRRSEHQLHKRLQRLLQILRVLSDRERRRPLRAQPRAARSKARRTFRRGRCSNPNARRTPPEVIVRLVPRFAPAHSRKISAY